MVRFQPERDLLIPAGAFAVKRKHRVAAPAGERSQIRRLANYSISDLTLGLGIAIRPDASDFAIIKKHCRVGVDHCERSDWMTGARHRVSGQAHKHPRHASPAAAFRRHGERHVRYTTITALFPRPILQA